MASKIHQAQANSLPSCPILSMCNILHNTEELHSGYMFRLDLSIAPPGCREEERWRKKKKKQKGGDDGRNAHNNSLFPCMLGPAA